jgi:small-conductance mechanosensitive channel
MKYGFQNFLGAIIMLALGVLIAAVFSRLFYPRLRNRYEQARLHGRWGVSPRTVMNIVKLINFIILPVLGFIFAGRFLTGQ